jgi:hypothetical protein
MILGYVLSARAWKQVGALRALAAIGLVFAADLMVGVAVSALLGTWAGWGRNDG